MHSVSRYRLRRGRSGYLCYLCRGVLQLPEETFTLATRKKSTGGRAGARMRVPFTNLTYRTFVLDCCQPNY